MCAFCTQCLGHDQVEYRICVPNIGAISFELRTQYKTASAAPEYCPFFLLKSNIVQTVIVFSSLVKSFSELFSITIAQDLKEFFVCLIERLL